MAHKPPALPDDRLYRAILLVLLISLLAGVGVVLAGKVVLRSEAAAAAGAWLAMVSGVVYFFFRWLGRREARRRLGDQDGRERGGEDLENTDER